MDGALAEARFETTAIRRYFYVVVFVLFFSSGFCSLIYQVVWIRLAFSHFGVITPVLSCVLSVFMLGLGIGSLLGSVWARWWNRRLGASLAYLYGGIETSIAIGGFIVPWLFQLGEESLLRSGETASFSSYFFISAILILVAILPWCTLMGATIPVMMSFIRQVESSNRSSFSFLYLANVVGALAGTLISALLLIEMFGFRATYMIAATINLCAAAIAFVLARSVTVPVTSSAESLDQRCAPAPAQGRAQSPRGWCQLVLFTTGLTALAMEVVWTRAFTSVLKTTIYSFAMILATYLLATSVGSSFYRRGLTARRLVSAEQVLGALCVLSLLPAVLNDQRLTQSAVLTLASIVPFCLALGYLTPRLIDEYSRGSPSDAGWVYGINIAGGILGPLLAAYVLLPAIGTRGSFLVLSIPMFVVFLWMMQHKRQFFRRAIPVFLPFAMMFSLTLFISRGYEDGTFYQAPQETRRDYTATVVAYGDGMNKRLLVNGIGMTFLTPITKVMAHLPLAMNNQARSGLVICFGMGTTFRAMHSWGIDTTAVELSRAVVDSFKFFFSDFSGVLSDPRSHVVIDDGRRYLLRSNRKFDVITVDPPPPIEAAASSLLYSEEFYDVVKTHLAPRGILQQWFPGGEDKIQYAVVRSLRESFPYVIAFRSIEDWGYHFLASMSPMDDMTPEVFATRLPPLAKRDLMEWSPDLSIDKMAENILIRRTELEKLLPPDGASMIVTDDHPYNEYFFLRRKSFMN